jgi:hypothetical protein
LNNRAVHLPFSNVAGRSANMAASLACFYFQAFSAGSAALFPPPPVLHSFRHEAVNSCGLRHPTA